MTDSPNVTIRPAPDEAPSSARVPVPVPAELDALGKIADIIGRLDPSAQRRTAAWVADKWSQT